MPGSYAIDNKIIRKPDKSCQLANNKAIDKMGAQQFHKEVEFKPPQLPFLPQGLKLSNNAPILTDQQLEFLSHLQFPFKEIMLAPILQSGKQFFQGICDKNCRPSGKGIYYTDKKSIFVGKFKGRQAEQFLYYILPNGAFFSGELTSTEIIYAKFEYPSTKTHYQGQINHNPQNQMRFVPHGTGSESNNDYKFYGIYKMGRKIKGRLVWTVNNVQCTYDGQFDEKGHFSGQGVLQEQTGRYKGSFFNGLKHGRGKYQYKSMLIYEGDYQHGIKSGKGSILNSDGTLSYQGQFYEGLPHGQGTAFMGMQPVQTRFIKGVPIQYQQFLDKNQEKVPKKQ